MQLCHKSTIPACYSLANVAIAREDTYDLIGYIRINIRIQQSYRANDHLSNLTGPVLVFVMAGSLNTSAEYNYQNAFRSVA